VLKSVSYSQFEKFWLEDKKLKYLKDQSSYDRLDSVYKASEHADSAHSAFLRSYVKDKGWPTFAEGGLYAMDLAVHDYLNYEFLFPILKEAYKAGKIPFRILRLIHDYSPSLDFFYRHEDDLSYHHEIVNVSSLVEHVMPDEKTTQKIQRIYNSHCPLKKIFLIYENSKVNTSYYLMPNELVMFSDKEHLLTNRFIDLFQRIPNKICKTDIAPYSDWIISDTKSDRLKLYICY
jgi:hypothetical protein